MLDVVLTDSKDFWKFLGDEIFVVFHTVMINLLKDTKKLCYKEKV